MNRAPVRALAILAVVALLAACGSETSSSYLASARAHLAKKQYNAAVIELKNALRLEPNNAEARYLLAVSLLDTGLAVDATTEARKALELKYPADQALPVLARALLAQNEFKRLIAETGGQQVGTAKTRAELATLRAQAFLGLGDTKAAGESLDAALAAEPGFAPARMARVRVALASGDAQGALSQLDAMLSSDGRNDEVLVLKAQIEGALGRTAEGVATLQRAVAAAPDRPFVRWALIAALINVGKIDEAAQEVAAVKKLAPDDPRTWYSEALVAYAQNNFKLASELVERTRQAAPDYLAAQYLSGLVDMRLDKFGSAETSLRAVLAKVPNEVSVRRALAALYVTRGRMAQALETLEPALRVRPDDPSLLRAVGEVYFASNNPPKAAELFARANKLDSGNIAGQVRLAQVNLTAGDSAQAVRDLEKLASSEKDSGEAEFALISAHLNAREYAKALAAAERLEKRRPKDPAVQNAKGVVYLAMRDNARARASFEKALSLNPDFATAAFQLARLDTLEKNYEGARGRYQSILAKDPRNGAALLALAELLAITKAPADDVRAAIERAVAASPASAQPRLALIAFHVGRRDWAAAVLAGQSAEAAVPDNPSILEALGVAQFASGEPNQAIATLKRAVQLRPDNAQPMLVLAELQTRMKDWDGAIQSMRSAVDVQPTSPPVWLALAAVYDEAGRLPAGMDEARGLQKRNADRAAGFGLEGELYARQKKWPEAIAAYRTALARQPDAAVMLRLLGLLEAAGKADEVQSTAQRWIRDHPRDVPVRAYLGEVAMRRGDYKGASQQLRNALEFDSENVVVANNLAWVLGEMGDPRAIEYAEKAYALAPGVAGINNTYGWLLVQKGDTARGIELLRRAVELAPNDANKRLILARALVKAGEKDAAKKELAELSKGDVPANMRDEAEKMLKGL
jgi:putative PEP-CTERM system TPR-repeat lipoprotein